jgi:hypothetical protein
MPCGGLSFGGGFFMLSAYHQFTTSSPPVLHMLGDILLGDPEIFALLADTRAGRNHSPAVAHGALLTYHHLFVVPIHDAAILAYLDGIDVPIWHTRTPGVVLTYQVPSSNVIKFTMESTIGEKHAFFRGRVGMGSLAALVYECDAVPGISLRLAPGEVLSQPVAVYAVRPSFLRLRWRRPGVRLPPPSLVRTWDAGHVPLFPRHATYPTYPTV